ncbi:MAG: Holliday junction branch migration protein RuvA, partial [Bryobacteraceae bacterium]|nr:Holliday junction branch migration protein RuvA [Bryobacteraceae bacterium]
SALPEPGVEVRLRIHTHVREDTLALYGFASEEEKMLFERLITVSGIGPRLAITVLSGLPVAELYASIRAGAVERLLRIPGVGRKTAERIVLELREKLPPAPGATCEAAPAAALSPVEQDVVSALINLGCTAAAAETAVRKARASGTAEEFEPLFRHALELLR